ncbi:transglutaminase-like domain-containing protein [Opitutales bacterium]|nr:transglutaminase-like domain-containing protein [Opitutales bacterium]
MKTFRLIQFLVNLVSRPSALLLFLVSGIQVAGANTEFTPVDRWYEVYLGGGKVGYVSDIMQKDGDVIKSRNEFVMQIKRAGQSIEITVEQETKEKISGELIEFSTETKMAGIPMLKKGRVEGEELVVYEKQFISGKETRYPFDPEGGMSWGLRKQVLENGFEEAGKTYELKVYSPDMGMKKPVKAKIICFGEKTIQIGEKKIKAFEVDMELKSPFGSMITKSWFDENCVALKTVMNMGGMKISIIEVPKKKAKKMEDEAHELLLSSVVPLDAAVPNSDKNIFIMKAIKGEWSAKLFEGNGQKIEKINDNSIRVIVDQSLKKKKVEGETDLKPFLSSSVYLDTDDLLIQKLAKKGKGKAKTSQEIANKLTKFVFRYMTNKNYEVGFATASEVARNKAGDCTEHSILLATLGRALGIPSRVVTGLVYADEFEDQKDVLVYHMWTQFYIDDQWVNLDSALGLVKCPADRITFSVDSLEEDTIASVLPLMELINNLKVTVQTIE